MKLRLPADIEVARRLWMEKPSASYLQRKMLISYRDALVLIDILKEEANLQQSTEKP